MLSPPVPLFDNKFRLAIYATFKITLWTVYIAFFWAVAIYCFKYYFSAAERAGPQFDFVHSYLLSARVAPGLSPYSGRNFFIRKTLACPKSGSKIRIIPADSLGHQQFYKTFSCHLFTSLSVNHYHRWKRCWVHCFTVFIFKFQSATKKPNFSFAVYVIVEIARVCP